MNPIFHDDDLLRPPAVEKLINHALKERSALALVRMGDGEGMALGQRDPFDPQFAKMRLNHFGPACSAERAGEIAAALEEAFAAASIVGLRPEAAILRLAPEDFALAPLDFMAKYRAAFALRDRPFPGYKSNLNYPAAFRLSQMAHQFVRIAPRLSGRPTLAWIHLKLLMSGALARLVRDAPALGLVTCRADVAATIAAFRAAAVPPGPTRIVDIPDIYAKAAAAGADPADWLAAMERVPARIGSVSPGEVWLVGAGVLGKLACHHVAERGGIALDIGSAFDVWGGLMSRPGIMPLYFMGMDGERGEVPPALLIGAQLAALGSCASAHSCDTAAE